MMGNGKSVSSGVSSTAFRVSLETDNTVEEQKRTGNGGEFR